MTAESRPSPIAVLHRSGRMVRALAATASSDGDPAAVRLVAWREFDLGDAEAVRAWLDERDPSRVIAIVPSSSIVCRTCTLPDTDPVHLAQALALQVEARIVGDVPPHRRAAAVLPAAESESSRTGVIVAWPQRGAAPPEIEMVGDRELSFCPDVAALGALLNGRRPNAPLVWADASDGSVALALAHANGAVLRAARVAIDGPDQWIDGVGRVIAETALSVSHTAGFIESMIDGTARALRDLDGQSGLVLPPDAHPADGGDTVPREPGWWPRYGLALGGVLAAHNGLAALTRLEFAAPAVTPSRLLQWTRALSSPRTALRVVAACLAIVLFGPMVLSGLRLGLLHLVTPDIESQLAGARRLEAQLAMYRELKNSAWPMSKLLADIACNTPEGVEVDLIRLRYGNPVTVAGRVGDKGGLTAQEVVTLMQERLRNSRIFEKVSLNWSDPSKFGTYDFNISAQVANPYYAFEYPRELDYGAWTLAERIYPEAFPDRESEPAAVPVSLDSDENGPGAAAPDDSDETDDDDAADDDAAELEPVSRGGRMTDAPSRRRDEREAGHKGDARDRQTVGVPESRDIPEPLTEAQIYAMDLTETQAAWKRVARALQRANMDDETRDRLQDEFKLITSRMRDLRRQERGTASGSGEGEP